MQRVEEEINKIPRVEGGEQYMLQHATKTLQQAISEQNKWVMIL